MSEHDWSSVTTDLYLVANIATLVQTAVVIAGVGFALSQLRQANQARELEALLRIFDRMRSDGRRASIEHMLTLSADISEWDDADLEIAHSEHEDFEQLGFLVRHRFLRERLIMEMYSLLIIDAWRALQPFELAEQERMGAPGFGRSFRELSNRATIYRGKRGLRIDGRVSRKATRASSSGVAFHQRHRLRRCRPTLKSWSKSQCRTEVNSAHPGCRYIRASTMWEFRSDPADLLDAPQREIATMEPGIGGMR